MNSRTTLFILLTLLGIQPVFSETPTPVSTPAQPDYSNTIKDLEDFIPDQMGKCHVKGLSIALVDGDKVVWMRGFGYSDWDKRIRTNGDTLYHIGALSKIFTAAEVLKLTQEGKVGLDDLLSKDLREFSINDRFKKLKKLTLRALLSNHSGLPGFFLKGIWVNEPESLAEFVQDLKAEYTVAPPQTLYKSSYVDYDLLGRMIELKRKKPFADAVKADLFESLGMDSTSFDGSSDLDPRLSKGYRNGDVMKLIHLRDVPSAGMVSSVNDMARFLQFLLSGRSQGPKTPLRKKTMDLMMKPQYPGLPLDFGHQTGLGWQLTGLNIEGAEATAWRDGLYPPYIGEMVALPKQGLGVIFLSNSGEGDIHGDVAARALKLMLMAKYKVKLDLNKKKIEVPKTIAVEPEKLEACEGYYSALGQLMKIVRQDTHLSANFQGHQLDLLPVAPDTFIPHLVFLIFPIDLPQYPLTFSNIKGQTMAVLGGMPFPVPLQRIAPVDIPDAWKQREGEYEMENPDGQFEMSKIALIEKDGFLRVEMKVSFKLFDIKDQEFKIALLPLSDGDAVVPGLFYGDGETLHVESDDPTRIYYSGFWFKKKEIPKPTPGLTPQLRPTI